MEVRRRSCPLSPSGTTYSERRRRDPGQPPRADHMDMANGLQQRVQPFPETIALLDSLAAKN